jgi:antitoxin MazE
MTKVAVSKWGNSLALRVPKHFADGLKLAIGTEMAVTVEGGRLVAEPVRRRVPLSELVKRITPKNTHSATDWGGPVGKEVW